MTETKARIDPKTSLRKFVFAGGSTPDLIELDPKKNGELLESCLDMFYVATGGNLWDSTASLSVSYGKGQFFQDGSVVTFIPVQIGGPDQVGVFTFSKDVDNPTVIASTLSVKCGLFVDGHKNLSGKFTVSSKIHSELDMLKAIANFAVATVSSQGN